MLSTSFKKNLKSHFNKDAFFQIWLVWPDYGSRIEIRKYEQLTDRFTMDRQTDRCRVHNACEHTDRGFSCIGYSSPNMNLELKKKMEKFY